MGTQACAPSGDAYGPCECDGVDTDSGSGTTGPNDDDDDADDGTDGDDESTGATDTTTGEDSSTGAAGCQPGTVIACDCDRGPGAATCNEAGTEYSACVCCEGSHPLVDGDLRYCEEGRCYCGDLIADPAIDVCYADVVAEVCCPVALECY